MICPPCKAAADLASGRDGTPIEAGCGLENAYGLVAKLHDRCTNCPCQHQISEITPTLPANCPACATD
ncbi:hypothetical protein [Actinoplanes sp. NPDC051851]|uniref:hypothetical protein n=1 Tax=Actinoplanes sp. NPDC051851 TaxID=3154753 RepID=UPI0034142449